MSLNLKAKLTLDHQPFTYGMNFAKSEIQKWNQVLERQKAANKSFWGGFRMAAVSAVAGLALLIKREVGKALEEGGKIQDLSDRIGADPEFLQRWGAYAKTGGSDIEGVVTAMQRLAVSSESAIAGDEEMAAAFDRLGVSAAELAGMTLQERFEALGRQLKDTTVDASLLADIIKVLGKSGSGMLPVFKGAGGEVPISTKESIARIDFMGDQIEALRGKWRKFWREVVDSPVPTFFSDLFSAGGASRAGRMAARKAQEGAVRLEGDSRAESAGAKAAAAAEAKAAKEKLRDEERIADLAERSRRAHLELNLDRAANDQERIALLQAELDRLVKANNSEPDRAKAAEAGLQALSVQRELESLKRKGQGNDAKDWWRYTQGGSDQLTSVGNFLGSSGRETEAVRSELRDIKAVLQRTHEWLREHPPSRGITAAL